MHETPTELEGKSNDANVTIALEPYTLHESTALMNMRHSVIVSCATDHVYITALICCYARVIISMRKSSQCD